MAIRTWSACSLLQRRPCCTTCWAHERSAAWTHTSKAHHSCHTWPECYLWYGLTKKHSLITDSESESGARPPAGSPPSSCPHTHHLLPQLLLYLSLYFGSRCTFSAAGAAVPLWSAAATHPGRRGGLVLDDYIYCVISHIHTAEASRGSHQQLEENLPKQQGEPNFLPLHLPLLNTWSFTWKGTSFTGGECPIIIPAQITEEPLCPLAASACFCR